MTFRYKILFLDVLFPLHVKKIIFVDADLVSIFQHFNGALGVLSRSVLTTPHSTVPFLLWFV